MEHSYSRDTKPTMANPLPTRTLMVHKPPQCPSCHIHPVDDSADLDEGNHPPIPSYNETLAKEAMNDTTRIANSVRNLNSDDQDWEDNINKIGWTTAQHNFFKNIASILDYDHLARLASKGKQHEPVHRRINIDKSADRFRKALASISWDSRLAQWLHGVLMEFLPPTYMAVYLDILQTLKTKLPILMDRILFGKPMSVNQELLSAVLKKQWEPVITPKTRKLPGNAIIFIIPSALSSGLSPRLQKWYQLLSTLCTVTYVNPNIGGSPLQKLSVEQAAEHLIAISKQKIKELRNEQPTRSIILVGFNTGAALALQLGLLENVCCICCMGFAFNTVNGIRGTPDDHILDITTPVMFVIGENSARSSQEEIESLREKMHCETSFVVVGSADDVLRVPKSKRQIDGVTQSMVDNMITDEIYEFFRNCIINPPPARIPPVPIIANVSNSNMSNIRRFGGNHSGSISIRKRRISQGSESNSPLAKKVTPLGNRFINRTKGRPISIVGGKQIISQPSNEILNMAIQSILPETDKPKAITNTNENDEENITSFEILSNPKLDVRSITGTGQKLSNAQIIVPVMQKTPLQRIKTISPNQIVHLNTTKTPNQQKVYTFKTANPNSSITSLDSVKNPTQVFTMKTTPTGTQFMPVTSSSNQHKFTLLKSGSTTIIGSGIDNNNKKTTNPKLSPTNIFDMPIVFADNDGNIQESVPIDTSTSNVLNTQQTIKNNENKTETNTLLLQKAKQNKVVYINPHTMKQCNIISKPNTQPLKYAKIVVKNPKTGATSFVTSPIINSVNTNDNDKTQTISIQRNKQVEILQNTIVKNANSSNNQSYPIVLNVESDNNSFKSLDSQIKPTILLKSGNLKSLPIIKSGVVNRNVTVRKINLLPSRTVSTLSGHTSITQIESPKANDISTIKTSQANNSLFTTTTNATKTTSNPSIVDSIDKME